MDKSRGFLRANGRPVGFIRLPDRSCEPCGPIRRMRSAGCAGHWDARASPPCFSVGAIQRERRAIAARPLFAFFAGGFLVRGFPDVGFLGDGARDFASAAWSAPKSASI